MSKHFLGCDEVSPFAFDPMHPSITSKGMSARKLEINDKNNNMHKWLVLDAGTVPAQVAAGQLAVTLEAIEPRPVVDLTDGSSRVAVPVPTVGWMARQGLVTLH